ncbi:uncharacterized protein F4822DRAFT_350364 [Hypoxylon trugodes]|uniref:uncharacterized protein n=1 Tax=Hypoxylon trugodes TaxID=326681 RepID=UPI002193497B|nr:uncharacterized protein F4822DRAFT_350364 [Hypoxylon trugodes]KAI1385649.1 hypothetical protein F4822DRAFT_350364 [Hypoxylon trugodes]
MSFHLNLRALPIGDNSTDTIINNVHFNLTTLNHWNYTYYPTNFTLSNDSSCVLMDSPYTPTSVLANGTFLNSTSCYSATGDIGNRARIGIAFAVVFALSLVFVLVNLKKHGELHLPAEKRFYPVGRRWQWYWAIFVCATSLVALFTGIDVDRYRVPELPIVLNVFFWFLMQMGIMALVWEGVRHWGSWMERQYIDPNPFVLKQNDKRGMFEFWLPLFFYFWLWMNFFLIVPRNWSPIEHQRSPEQTLQDAVPAATDGRFKAATFCLFVCWLTTMVSLWHSIRHYEPRNRGFFNRAIGFWGYMPFRFTLMTPLALAVVAYQGLCAWDFNLSPLKVGTNLLAMYLGGYAPTLLILIVQILGGFTRPNEDRELIRQRRERGQAIDQELGLVRKPAWWRRVNGDVSAGNMRDRIMRNVREVGGGRPTAREIERLAERRAQEAETAAENRNNTIEMNEMRRTNSVHSSIRGAAAPPPYSPHGGKSDRRRSERTVQVAASLLFPNANAEANADTSAGRGRGLEVTSDPPRRPGTSERSSSTASGLSTSGPPQQIRSMLDV